MPGLVGIISKRGREWAEPQVQRMLKAICHEQFYQSGQWADESLGVCLGWTALKNSFADRMPLINEAGDIVLTFSGEEFPHPDTICRLQQKGHLFKNAGSDYLVHLCEDDPTFPSALNGRFHGLVADRRRAVAVLFNDRYGMHAVYYHESKDAFYFASEVKAILAVRPELRVIDARSLGEFVSCGCVLEDRTLFAGIYVLPPASRWSFENGALVNRGRYFDLQEWQDQEPLTSETYYHELEEIFRRNLPRYFDSRQPVGMSLTGGLDTRMIMAWQRQEPGSLPCYTFGGSYRNCRDVVVAKQVAAACEQPHQVITVDGEFLARFPHYAERTVYLTDGMLDVGRSPALYANEKAREIAPVRMAGIYGSEVLRWLPGFKPVRPSTDLYRPELLHYVYEAEKTYAKLRALHPVAFVLFQPAPQRGVNVLEESQVTIRSPYLDNDFVRTAFRAPNPSFANSDVFSKKDVSLRLIAAGNKTLRSIYTDRGLAGPSEGMKAAVTRGLLEFSFKAEYAYDYGMPQWVARVDHTLSRMQLERLFLGRHKFYHFRIWYRDALSKYIREVLLDSRSLSRGYLDGNRVTEMVETHVKGTKNYTTEIHKLLTLELAHRLFVDAH